MFSGSKDCGLIMWDLNTGAKLARIEGGRKGTENVHKGHCTTVNAIAVSSDTKFLVKVYFFLICKRFGLKLWFFSKASGDDSKLIRIWKLSTQFPFLELIHTFKGHRDSVSGLAFRLVYKQKIL